MNDEENSAEKKTKKKTTTTLTTLKQLIKTVKINKIIITGRIRERMYASK
jgi:hypothetical protein